MGKTTLKFDVDEIPEAGKTISTELPTDWLGDTLLATYTATSPLRLDLLVRKFQDNVHIEGSMAIDLTFACSRTLKPGQTQLNVHLGDLFIPSEAHKLNLGSGVESEELVDEPYTYADNQIDLETFLREQLVLAQDPYPRVEDDGLDEGDAIWTNQTDDIDPRWAKLKNIKLKPAEDAN